MLPERYGKTLICQKLEAAHYHHIPADRIPYLDVGFLTVLITHCSMMEQIRARREL